MRTFRPITLTRVRLSILPLCLSLWLAGCYAGYFVYKFHGGGADAAVGEEHEVNFPANEAFELSQDVLRGQGILFETQPQFQIVTFWKNADNPPGVFPSLIGIRPRYRYEIQVIPEGANRSKIVANVRAEDVPDDEVDRYQASRRIDFFHKLDELATSLPPEPNTPSSGGVNFALLPHEDLQGLAKRVTGSAANWKQIAEDNGISSPADVAPFQTIWVRSGLLRNKPKQAE